MSTDRPARSRSRPNVFAAILPRLAQGYALDALGVTDTGPERDAAERFLESALDSPRARQATPGIGRAFGIESVRVVGSGLELDAELVQLFAFPGGRRGTQSSTARI